MTASGRLLPVTKGLIRPKAAPSLAAYFHKRLPVFS